MTLPELLTYLGLTGGGAGLPALLRFLGKVIDKRKGPRSFQPPDEVPVVQQGPRRSLSPSSFAAVIKEKVSEGIEELDDKKMARESLLQQGQQTELLRQLVAGIERIPDRIDSVAVALHEDIKDTRHEIRGDCGAIHLEIAGLAGPERFRQVQGLIAKQEASDPLPPRRQRMPSRPGGE